MSAEDKREDAGLGDNTPNPESAEELTVEDILNEPQTDAAKQQDKCCGGNSCGDDTESDADTDADQADETAESINPLEDTANPYLEDLRRITAEYANYRKRTEENAQLERDRQAARVIASILPVLDDLQRAETHGDLEEGTPFQQIATKLRDGLAKLGLETYGEKGEVFDPKRHEAIAEVPVPDAEPGTVLDVVECGYSLNGVEIRAAKVAVVAAPAA